MKTISAREAKNHFGKFLDASRREPVIVTKNNCPVGIMISIEDAVDTLIPEMFMDKETGYDEWLTAKVTNTLKRVESSSTTLLTHDEAMLQLASRVKDKLEN